MSDRFMTRFRAAMRVLFPADERFTEAAGASAEIDDDEGWRRLSVDPNRELSPMAQVRMRDTAVYLLRSNPLANRLIELPVAYLLAEGVTLSCDDEQAQQWLDAFWHDPITKMDLNLPKFVRELAVFGEQCWVAFVNEQNGHTRLGYLDPGAIATVVWDPDNRAQPIGIVTAKDRKGNAKRYRVIVNGPEAVFSNRTRQIRQTFDDGSCFYFDINALVTDERGKSDLLPLMDSLDAYDQALFGELERWNFMRAFIWDVTLAGATQEEVEKRARDITTPAPGSARIHNDSETWNAVAPDLKGGDSEILTRIFRNHILGGNTLPEHWYGGGGDVNRATAAEMGEPTFKVLAMRQRLVKHMLEEVGYFVVWNRLKVEGEPPDPSGFDPALRPVANFAEMTSRDTTKYATAFQQVVTGAALAADRGFLTEETAVGVIATVAGQLGYEIDPKDELEKAREQALGRREEDLYPDLPEDGDGDDGGQAEN